MNYNCLNINSNNQFHYLVFLNYRTFMIPGFSNEYTSIVNKVLKLIISIENKYFLLILFLRRQGLESTINQ